MEYVINQARGQTCKRLLSVVQLILHVIIRDLGLLSNAFAARHV
jgi:hypothetical protein